MTWLFVHWPLAKGLKIEAPKETMADRLKRLSKEINKDAKKSAPSTKKVVALLYECFLRLGV